MVRNGAVFVRFYREIRVGPTGKMKRKPRNSSDSTNGRNSCSRRRKKNPPKERKNRAKPIARLPNKTARWSHWKEKKRNKTKRQHVCDLSFIRVFEVANNLNFFSQNAFCVTHKKGGERTFFGGIFRFFLVWVRPFFIIKRWRGRRRRRRRRSRPRRPPRWFCTCAFSSASSRLFAGGARLSPLCFDYRRRSVRCGRSFRPDRWQQFHDKIHQINTWFGSHWHYGIHCKVKLDITP